MRILLSVVVFAAGCLTQVAPDHPASEQVPSDQSVLEMLASGSYRGPDFVKLNKAPYPTMIPSDGDPLDINVYVSALHAADYEPMQPTTAHEGMTVPPGLTIVREVETTRGVPVKLTVMVRHEDGWNPTGGDFMYGVTDLSGTPMADPHDGSTQWGKLATCASCHQTRAGDAWVYGVPDSVR